jgi:hypothetical protein
MKIGDIVRVIKPFWSDYDDPNVGSLAYIEEGEHRFCIRFLKNGGQSAWWDEEQLEYVRPSTQKDIDEMDRIALETKARQHNLNWLKEQLINDTISNINPDGWLYLFSLIDYESAFNKNGEFFALYYDIILLLPLFAAAVHEDLEALEAGLIIFKEEYRDLWKERVLNLMFKFQTKEN